MIIEVQNELDCQICDDFLTQLIQDERNYDNTISSDFVVKNYFKNMLGNGNVLLLYKIQDEAVGYAFLKKLDQTYLIDGVFVKEKYRGNGIGTKLIQELMKKVGNNSIDVNVMCANKNAINLYKKIGFKEFKMTMRKN